MVLAMFSGVSGIGSGSSSGGRPTGRFGASSLGVACCSLDDDRLRVLDFLCLLTHSLLCLPLSVEAPFHTAGFGRDASRRKNSPV